MDGYLDIRTLAFVSALISAVLSSAMLYIYVARKTYPGFGLWVCGVSFHTAGMLLLASRGHVPDLFSVVVANLFIALYLVFLTCGGTAFVGGRQRIWLHAASTVFLAAETLYFTYIVPSVSTRIVTISVILILYGLWLGSIIIRKVPLLLGRINWFLTVAVGAFVCWLAVRIVLTLLFERQMNELMSPSFVQGASFVVFALLNVLSSLGLIILNFQRLENDLLKSLEEVRTLRGIIPICSVCKKIRDDQGYWNQLEAYMREHADIRFSHGICPECREKLYPAPKTGEDQ